jgi:hypothetical protein
MRLIVCRLIVNISLILRNGRHSKNRWPQRPFSTGRAGFFSRGIGIRMRVAPNLYQRNRTRRSKSKRLNCAENSSEFECSTRQIACKYFTGRYQQEKNKYKIDRVIQSGNFVFKTTTYATSVSRYSPHLGLNLLFESRIQVSLILYLQHLVFHYFPEFC